MGDLVSRVLAAINAEEAKARTANELDGYSVHISDADVQEFWEDNGPAAVLRHCKADAALVALHRPVVDSGPGSAWPPPGHCAVCWLGGDYEPFPCPTMRTLALGYGISAEEEPT